MLLFQMIATLGIIYSSYRMFTFYWNLQNEDVSDLIKDGMKLINFNFN